MLKNTVFLAVLLLQTLSFTVALPSPIDGQVKGVAVEDGHARNGDVGDHKDHDCDPCENHDHDHDHDHDGGDDNNHCDNTTVTITDQVPG